MNDQPYGIPDKHWPAKLTYWWYRAARSLRRKALAQQQITSVQIEQIEHLQGALDAQLGVMLTPNHSFHWDSYCLFQAADRLKTPFYVMTAWQVFSKSKWFERESMQRCGCCGRICCALCETFESCYRCGDSFCALSTCAGVSGRCKGCGSS
jgi:1-acyl-sn-glycerol-3-phosphate acyltransferase